VPAEVSTDKAPVYPAGLEELLPASWHRTDRYANIRIRVGYLNRRPQHLGARRTDHVVEPATELRVTIADGEAHPASWFPEHQQQVAGLLGDQAALGLGVTLARWTRRVSSSMKNSTYSRHSKTVSTVKQVAGDDPGGLLA
jgi:hypothetical protein